MIFKGLAIFLIFTSDKLGILTYQRQFIAKTLLFLWIILNLDKIAQMNGAFLDKMTRLDCRLLFDCMTIKIEKKTKKEYQNESKRQADR